MSEPQIFEVLERWPVLLAEVDRDPKRLDLARVVFQPGDTPTLSDAGTIRSGLSIGKIRPAAPPPVVEVAAGDLPSPSVVVAGDALDPAALAGPPSDVVVEVTEEPVAPAALAPSAKKKAAGRKPHRRRARRS